MINRIIKLSKVLIKEYFQNLEIFNKRKVNKKTLYAWLIIIVIGVIGFYSFKIIDFLNDIGQGILFLKVYFYILAIVFMFQAILVCCNIFFFSKDLEYILPLPIKPTELLIAKFNNVLSIIYSMEGIFLLVPLVIYGIVCIKSISYYCIVLLVLMIFPIFLITIINILMLVIIQLTKFIKNKEVLHILIVIILSFILTFAETHLFTSIFNTDIGNIEVLNNKFDKLNNYFIVINPCINLLTNIQIANICYQLIRLILILLQLEYS